MNMWRLSASLVLTMLIAGTAWAAPAVRIKDIARVQGPYEAPLVGYGLVVGLAGSGDSGRNKATAQSLVNTLANFGVHISQDELSSRNTAAVMVTTKLSPFAEQGDRIDLQVSSLGDARSLAGGTLLMTPLYGPDQKLYALGQGPLAVGGHAFEAPAASVQKNYPTVGRIPGGGVIERSPNQAMDVGASSLSIVLDSADHTTAQRVASAIMQAEGGLAARVIHPGKVRVEYDAGRDVMALVARLESLVVVPDYGARVVINERTGTVVAGSNVVIGEVSVTHGGLQIDIANDYLVSQPDFVINPGRSGVRTEVVPQSDIQVQEAPGKLIELGDGTTVGDLVRALNRLRLGSRDVISIVQAMHAAGALHAEIIVQ